MQPTQKSKILFKKRFISEDACSTRVFSFLVIASMYQTGATDSNSVCEEIF